MSEGDNSRRSDISERNATRAGVLAVVVLVSSIVGGPLIVESASRPVQGAGPLPPERGLLPINQPLPTQCLEWDNQVQVGEVR